jgi:hypothetical protein
VLRCSDAHWHGLPGHFSARPRCLRRCVPLPNAAHAFAPARLAPSVCNRTLDADAVAVRRLARVPGGLARDTDESRHGQHADELRPRGYHEPGRDAPRVRDQGACGDEPIRDAGAVQPAKQPGARRQCGPELHVVRRGGFDDRLDGSPIAVDEADDPPVLECGSGG